MVPGHEEYYYGIDGQRFGPVGLDEVRRLIQEGKLRPGDYLWDEDTDEWMPVWQFPALRAAPPPSPPGPAPGGEDAQFAPPTTAHDSSETTARADSHETASGDRADPSGGADVSSGARGARLGPGASPISPVAPATEAWARAYGVRQPATAPYAGFGIRLVAHVIDSFLLLMPLLVWGIIASNLAGLDAEALSQGPVEEWGNWEDPAQQRYMLYFYAGAIVLEWLYRAGLEASSWQATLGKRAMGLVVVDTAGYRLTFLRASARHFGKVLSQIPFSFGFFMIALTAKKQGLHDKLADTLVLRI